MNGAVEDVARSYISSHSADVILSDIRPTKLTADALRSINVFLDEVLYLLLTTADSLSTDKLRAAILKILPTSLGKEALLEAEVELRAYWDRTKPPAAGTSRTSDEWKCFNLQWAFELLRFKCEAYSTLNEIEESSSGELKVNERMGMVGGPPKALVAPAALYLTAILEAICEHILSNIGRVAARDSSRTNATIQDLFVALCEDDSVYALFRSMKVFEQIENLSRVTGTKRSKSISRGSERTLSFSRTSSPLLDTASNHSHKNRLSVDTGAPMPVPASTITSPGSAARTSSEKTRAMKMFIANSKVSGEYPSPAVDSTVQHQRTFSAISDEPKQPSLNHDNYEGSYTDYEDATLVAEFDDLMRSDSTMKVSLTPDRLKTMELYKKEKSLRDQKRAPPPPLSWSENPADATPPLPPIPPQRANGRRPSLLQVASSINEGDEDEFSINAGSGATRAPRNGVAQPQTNKIVGSLQARIRSNSNAASNNVPPSLRSSSSAAQIDQIRSKVGDPSFNRSRVKPELRESIDLEDIDDSEDEGNATFQTSGQARRGVKSRDRPSEHKTNGALSPRGNAVSPSTRELIDFLAGGPPSENLPPTVSAISLESGGGRTRSGSRLKRMMSKLSIASDKGPKIGRSSAPGSPPKSAPVMAGLANRPIPPRPPRPISPPSSPSAHSLEMHSAPPTQLRQPPMSRKPQDSIYEPPGLDAIDGALVGNGRLNNISNPERVKPSHSQQSQIDGGSHTDPSGPPAGRLPSKLDIPASSPKPPRPEMSPARRSTKPLKPDTVTPQAPPSPGLQLVDMEALRRLIANASTADECRLILGMYIPRFGSSGQPDCDVPYPSPTPSPAFQTQHSEDETALENSLLELLLGV